MIHDLPTDKWFGCSANAAGALFPYDVCAYLSAFMSESNRII